MKLYDAVVEARILKTLCDSKGIQSKLYSKIESDFFGNPNSLEIYARIVNLTRSGKPIPTSDLLAHDGVLSAESQNLIGGSLKVVYEDELDPTIEILQKYRKVRLIHESTQTVVDTMKQDNPDVDGVVSHLENLLLKMKVSKDADDILHIGKNGNADSVVEEILFHKREDFIPTGFKEFDTRTGGFAKKNVITVAANSGGGKSSLAMQMAINQYKLGFNVCLASFEMEKVEIMTRVLSNLGYVSHELIHLREFSPEIRKKIIKAWDKFCEDGETKGNRLTIYCPSRDLSINDIFIEVKPFNYDIIYIDYIGLLKQAEKKAMWESFGEIARAAKLGANNLNAAVVLLAQLDEDTLKVKYSKALTHNSHFVWTWVYGEKEQELGVIEINQTKVRNAKRYKFYLNADFERMTISDYEGAPPTSEDTVDKSKVPSMKDLV